MQALIDYIQSQDWLDSAACAGKDPAIFFPPEVPAGRFSWKPAQQICGLCPVRRDCLKANLDLEYGYVGGKTPNERSLLRGAA